MPPLSFVLLIRPPPTSTLFPYTTLFRSAMEPADILIVTPYNAQIRTIQRALAASGQTGFRVGTVDKLQGQEAPDRKSTRLNSSHPSISYAVFCLKKKKKNKNNHNSKKPI